MSSVTRVPETSSMRGGELTADDARQTLKVYGRWHLAKEAFVRFRYGDGFTSARALAMQLCLSLIPLAIAVVGLSSTLHTDRAGEALHRTLLALVPGSSQDVVRQTLERSQHESGSGGQIALLAGLVSALVALTTAMGQVERGSNRIYGIQRDRPSKEKYTRTLPLTLGAGLPAIAGFLLVIAGGAVARSIQAVYGHGGTLLQVVRWPVGVLLMLGSITLLMRFAPRRAQPGPSWLAFGAAVALVLWLVFSSLLALYVSSSSTFGTVYGPLTGIIALLIWANLTALSLFLGMAFAAQLEAVRAGVHDGATEDPERFRPVASRRAGATSTSQSRS